MKTTNFELEQMFEQCLARTSDHPLLRWISLLEIPDFETFFKQGEELYVSEQFAAAKNFIIVWLILGSEAKYDLTRRAHYIGLMNQLRLENFDTYLEFYSVFFTAVKYFYDGDLIQSKTYNDIAIKMAIKIGCHRGHARALFHQALTYFDMEQPAEGFHFLQECLNSAKIHKLDKSTTKAETEYHRQKNNPYLKTDHLDNKIDILKMHIEDKNIEGARKALAQAEKARRQMQFNKAKYSLYFYRTQIQILQKNPHGVRRTLNTIMDPVLISKIYDMMIEEQMLLLPKEQSHNRILKLQFNHYTLSETNDVEHQSLDPIFLKNIKNEDVRALLSLLLKTDEPLTKEDIINNLFNFNYDPTIHDQRLYKLILRTRKEINSDLIINHYGKYSLNIKKYKIVI